VSYVENAAPVVSRHSTMLAPPPPSASRLLRVEHAVAEALLETDSADEAFLVIAGVMIEAAEEEEARQYALAA